MLDWDKIKKRMGEQLESTARVERALSSREPLTTGGGRRVPVVLSDGREFHSISDAALALGVVHSQVGEALRNGTLVRGVGVKRKRKE